MTAFMTACIFVVLAEMGDKTQLLAMAFATKYNWKTVMAGVFAATVFNHLFAVAVGSYLTEFVPMSTIQLAASVSFIIFGLWTIRGDKLEGEDKERGMSPFWTVAVAFFLAEMGDKTQLMLIALTSKYKLRDIISGTAVAILVLNGLAVLAGGLVSEFIPDWLIKTIAALAFLYFAASTIAWDDDDEEEGSGKSKIKFAPLAVFCTFFIAELGDKTQLTAITFGANEGMSAALVVWIGCSLGLFAADILGMLVGYLLKSKTPDGLLNTLAFAIFSIFGVYTLYQGLKLIKASVCPIPVWPILIAATVVFVVICVCLFIRRDKKKNN